MQAVEALTLLYVPATHMEYVVAPTTLLYAPIGTRRQTYMSGGIVYLPAGQSVAVGGRVGAAGGGVGEALGMIDGAKEFKIQTVAPAFE